ncbi:NXPE family member 1-like [Antedon mediterranea]|uniref:NXPE family member 1-like n=1 Tax=Antedon mediterranea TaxID=105859 RepID=UPI003AF7EC57
MLSKLKIFIVACIICSLVVIAKIKLSPYDQPHGIRQNIKTQFISDSFNSCSISENNSMIDINRSFIYLKNPDRPVKVGDFFSVIIQARDLYSQCTSGYDFFFATMNSKENHNTGKITDLKNGTYEVLFFAGWPGVINISIVLVHPSEAVYFIEQEIWPLEKRLAWKGYFEQNKSETQFCSISKKALLGVDKCQYSHPLAMGETVFFCDKPMKSSCDRLSWLQTNSPYIGSVFSKLYSSHQQLFSKSVTYARLVQGTTSIKISKEGNLPLVISRLPECRADLQMPLSDGFWTNDVWTSLHCKTKQWTKQEITKCIRGKHMILMGDSTTRQWTEQLLNIMGVTKSKYTTKPNTKHIRHHSTSMMLDFYFHPYTLGSPTFYYRVGKWEYEILNNLKKKDCNYVIIVSPWAHYIQWTKDSYTERLHLLREALVRFMKRCPNAKIVVKTSHPRNHPSTNSLLYASDKIVYNIYKLFVSIFSGLGIHIIDIWDMNLSYPSMNTIHMPSPVIHQELFLMFSHICPL